MKAMILAAGLGKRLRPLTDHTPKPLIQVGHKRLIEYPLFALASAGITDIVINTHHLAEQFEPILQQGQPYGVNITYCHEPEILGTGGGILNTLPLLGSSPFLVVNADVWTDIPFNTLTLPTDSLAHLVVVENPTEFAGDFCLDNGLITVKEQNLYTYTGIGIFHPEFFANIPVEAQPLSPLIRQQTENEKVTGQVHHGQWVDAGTPERLEALKKRLTS